MSIKRLCLAFVLLVVATSVANCCCLGMVGLNSLNYPRQWYSESFDPASAQNVLIRISAMTMGKNPILITDSDSDKITISILYYNAPQFKDYRHGDNYTIAAYASYLSDWTNGIGADIIVYLPGNANYTVNIRNMDTRTLPTINYTRGNLTYWVNDLNHSMPSQASALYYEDNS